MASSARFRFARSAVFGAVTAVVVGKFLSGQRIAQDPRYHAFADRRAFLGVPNALDVLSNAGFLLVGAWGIAVVLRGATFRDARERIPWLVLFVGVTLTSFGSAWYHLAPTNATLIWDRLPMTLGFMGLFAALIVERVGTKSGTVLLPPLVMAGVASVLYWAVTESRGAGDLRPYYVVQFYPLIASPLLLVLFPPRYDRGGDLLIALAWYVAAKVAETYDLSIYQATGIVSGHTLKHVLATIGIAWLGRMLTLRELQLDSAALQPNPARDIA